MIAVREISTHIRKDNDVYTYRLNHKPSGVSAEATSKDFSESKSQCEKDLEEKLGDTIERNHEA